MQYLLVIDGDNPFLEERLTNGSNFIGKDPSLAGLRFRHFRGESDYPGMQAVLLSSAAADKIERADTLEDIARNYSRLSNCDPYQDMIMAELAGELVGYARGWWWDETGTGRIYESAGFLAPTWRRQGIGSSMLQWIEQR